MVKLQGDQRAGAIIVTKRGDGLPPCVRPICLLCLIADVHHLNGIALLFWHTLTMTQRWITFQQLSICLETTYHRLLAR